MEAMNDDIHGVENIDDIYEILEMLMILIQSVILVKLMPLDMTMHMI